MAKKQNVGGGEWEHHIVATRLRITGSGQFKQTLESYQAVRTQNLLDLPIVASTAVEPMRLANFQAQRIRLVGKVSGIDQNFTIGRIIIYAKPVAAEYPNLT